MLTIKIPAVLRTLLFVCAAILVDVSAFAQVPGFAWAKGVGGDETISGTAIASDALGNVYTTGSFRGTHDFDPGMGTFELTAEDADGFVSKVDANGNFVWAIRFGAEQFDEGTSISIDAEENVLVGGFFGETVDFDPGPDIFNVTSFGDADGIILKLSPAGDFIFAKQVGGAAYDHIQAIRTDFSSNIYVVGWFLGVADFDPDATAFELTSNGLSDAFITKLDAAGNFEWAKHFGGDGEDYDFGDALAIDPVGNVYIAGKFGDGDSDEYQIFINKMDNAGNEIWNYQTAGVGNNEIHSIQSDATGDIYFSGDIDDTVDFDPLGTGFDLEGPNNYICKLNSSGGLIWITGLGDNFHISSMTLDIDENIFFTGTYNEMFDADPGVGIATVFGFSEDDDDIDYGMFVLKLDNNGNYVWAQGFNDQSSEETGIFITTDNTGNIFVLAAIDGTSDFATGICLTGQLAAIGPGNLVLIKFNPTSVPATCFGVIEQPVSRGACEGSDVWLSAYAAGTSRIIYQWQKFNGSVFVDISDQEGGDGENGYEGTNTPYLHIYIVNGTGTEQYRCRISGESVTDISSDVATLTLSGSNSIPYVVANSGCGPGQYMITGFGGTEGNYQWYEEGALIEGAVNSSYTTSLLSTPTGFSVAKSTGDCVSGQVNVEVNVNACPPVPGLVWAAQPQTTTGTVNITDMVNDAAGNLYVVGYFYGTVDFDNGPGTAILSTAIVDERENFLLKLTRDNEVVWVTSLGDIALTIHLSLDGAGSQYLAGTFSGTIDFDPGSATFELTAAANRDMFITKLNTDGDFIWAKRMGGTGTNVVTPQSVASDGNGVYTTGNFSGTIDFDPNAGTQNISSAGATAFGDIFISKLDPDGNFAWAHRMGRTSASDGGRAIEVDASGNVYSIGTFSGTVDFDPGAGSSLLTGGGATDTYIHKLNNAGLFQWALTIGGAGVELPFALALDASGNPHIAGTFGTITANQTVDFDPGAGTFDLVSNEGIIFILKLNPDGIFTWAKNFGGTFGAEPSDIAVDVSGNVLMTGYAEGNYDFDPGPAIYRLKSNVNRDIVVTQFDVNGDFSWAFNMASTGLSYFDNEGVSIVTDPDGSIYTAGTFSHTSDLDPGHCTFPLFASEGGSFIQKIRPGVATICFNVQPIAAAGCTGTPAIFRVAATGTTNITYQWQKLNTSTSLFDDISDTGGYAGTATPDLEIDTHGAFGDGTYRCLVTGDDAPDKTSEAVSLIVNVVPSPPITTGSNACPDATQTLTASGSTDGNYRWYKDELGETVIAGEINSIYATSGISETTTYYVSIHNGNCESARTPVVAIAIEVPSMPTVMPGARCGSGTVTLAADGGTAGEYRWYDVETAGTALPGETSNELTTSELTSTTTYYVALNNGTCESARVAVTATVHDNPAQPSITPSGTTTFCAGGSVTLAASTASGFTWSTGETTQQITVNGAGDYTVRVTDANGCTSPESDAITVTIENCNQPPTIATAPLAAPLGGILTFNLLTLLGDPDDNLDMSTLQVVAQPESGAVASIDPNGNLIIDYSATTFTGTDRLVIEVCDTDGICAQQELLVDVIGDITVYNALSPNGDGRNDAFVIQYIADIPETQNNKVTIFNRWGDVISEIKNYDNEEQVFKGLNKSGGEVPSGTYFYKIEFNSGRTAMMGYLVLKR